MVLFSKMAEHWSHPLWEKKCCKGYIKSTWRSKNQNDEQEMFYSGDTISRYTICLEYRQQNTKEPTIPSRIPSKPWGMAATDLFTWDKSEYLIIFDYHSRSFEEAKLPDTKSTTVITYTKSIFARHGIPSEVISDNSPQYSSKDFSPFATQWEFKHTTVSLLHPRANGLIEKAVQTVRNVLTKAKQDHRGLIWDCLNTGTSQLMVLVHQCNWAGD